MGTYKVRIRLDCERFNFVLRRRVFDVLEECFFENVAECIRFIDESLKSEEFVSKYFGCKLKLEILDINEVKFFVTIHLGWNRETVFLFSSDEAILPLKEEYYHKKQETSIWGPTPEW